MKENKKQTRDGHAYRIWKEYWDRHACGAGRTIERKRIESSGHVEEHCDYCGMQYSHGMYMDGKWLREPRRRFCIHPGYKLTFRCTICRYACHEYGKAKKHLFEQGHHMKCVELRWTATTTPPF